ncbi:hypothetical protein [Mucilaginibacter sp. UYCu711]|uniref:hypothetical protein n=1 Tax=Mucilaginibacter sp. UYCu711 TaxID=3156339 RepID=UPI003D207CCB
MKLLIYLITAITLFAATSCKKQTVIPNIDQQIEQQLVGKWKFESLFFASTHTLYVAIPSQLDIVEFKADHKFVRSTNAEITQQGNYDIVQAKSIFTQKDDNLLRFNPQSVPAQETDIISIKGDTLTMSQNVYDGYVSKFSKVK